MKSEGGRREKLSIQGSRHKFLAQCDSPDEGTISTTLYLTCAFFFFEIWVKQTTSRITQISPRHTAFHTL